MAKKKRLPCILFNDGDYKYPNGLHITDADDRDIKLKSGEWNTGPVDNKGQEAPKREQPPKKMTVSELIEFAKSNGMEIVGDVDGVKTGIEGTPKKKHLSHMNTAELVELAESLTITVDENWTKKELQDAIKAHKE